MLIIVTIRYPSNNCYASTGKGLNTSSQEIFASFLNHSSGVDIVEQYSNSAKIAQEAGLPLLMTETNTASCGGFPGVSDSFGAALWALDYGLQMAFGNFSGAFFHITGQNSSFNVRPFFRSFRDKNTYNDVPRPLLVCIHLSTT
jgi:hypothetical protein